MKVKVWDGAIRLFHWALGLAVLGAFLTSEDDGWAPTHARLGLAVVGLLVFRLAWGLWGSPHARFSSFVRAPREVLAYAREYVRGRPGRHLGHNPLGGAMVVALLAVLGGMTVTGLLLVLGPEWDGPLSGVLTMRGAKAIAQVHEALSGALLAMIAAHVAGVLLSSVIERQNLVAGMITGWKRADGASPEPRRKALALRLTLALLLAFAVVRGLLGFLPVAPAEAAANPRQLLAGYEALARAQEPGFKGFDAERGGAFYARGHEQNGKSASCASCHGADPMQPGRSAAGKRLEPFAPGAASERFTDEANVEKWFGRNCKQVLGRPCTAREKGDLLSWLLTK